MAGTRRDLVRAVMGAGATARLSGATTADAAGPVGPIPPIPPEPPRPFPIALNTSTISGQQPTILDAIRIAARAGYDGIEPWIRELDAHVRAGGSLADLGKQARDANLAIVDAIGFFEWAVDDDTRRAKGLEEARRNMALVAQVGGRRIAAPPFGAADARSPRLDLDRVAERYRALLEIGRDHGVTPLVEVWGFSRNITTLADATHVAAGADHPDAAILADVYHLYKGGSGVVGLKLLGRDAVPILHINDYPARPRGDLADSDRVYPGDGVAPLTAILRALRDAGSATVLSLELFNRDLWKLDPATVAARGLAKIRAAVATLG